MQDIVEDLMHEAAAEEAVERMLEKVQTSKKKAKAKREPAPLTTEQKLELEVKLLKAKLNAALGGNTALLTELKYVLYILAQATGMQEHEVYAAIRERSITIED